MVRIVTDTSTLISREAGAAMGIDVVPLCVNINQHEYRDLEVDMDDFYQQIADGGIPKSSQPPIGEFVELYEKYAGEEILNIAMVHGLSGTYQTALGARELVENKEDITVLNSDCICGPHRYLVKKAKEMADKGKNVKEILAFLEERIATHDAFLIAQDYDYLRRGGRLTPIAARFIGALKVKPLVHMVHHGEKGARLDAYGVSRTLSGCVKKIVAHFQERGIDNGYLISIGHARVPKDAEEIAKLIQEKLGKVEIEMIELSPAFVTQGGPGCISVQCIKM